jgi:putative glutamine amidotransferase
MNYNQIGNISVFVLTTLITVLSACKPMDNKPLRIALSSANENYIKWVNRADSTAEVIDFKGMNIDSALRLLSTCDAIVFTGGEDVVPTYYGKGQDSSRCESNPARDSLEFALIAESWRLKLPVFGVCRGQQILNVSLGGTLIVDIPADHPGNVVHQMEDYLHCYHHVNIVNDSKLNSFALADTGMVTSNHHQAIEKLAPGLRITAWSNDSIPEAIEWAEPDAKPFFIAVQWHPERMDVQNPLSMPLMDSFLKAAGVFRRTK